MNGLAYLMFTPSETESVTCRAVIDLVKIVVDAKGRGEGHGLIVQLTCLLYDQMLYLCVVYLAVRWDGRDSDACNNKKITTS